jgi:elongation factor P
MLSLTDVKVSTKVEIDGDPYEIVWREHSKIGRGGAVLRTKMKNLRTGNVVSRTFQGNESLQEADLSRNYAQYLYNDDKIFFFMDTGSYEQFSLTQNQLGEAAQFLIEGTTVSVLVFNSQPINIDLPIKIDLKVIESPPALRGNTADGGSKQVKLETGHTLNVPLFIKEGDIIKVNTRDGKYVERTNAGNL